MITTLLDAVTTTGAGSSKALGGVRHRPGAKGIVQAVLTGTATVKLEGSLDDSNWFDLVTFAASEAAEVSLPLFVRGNVTARTSGAITLKLEH